MSKFNLKKPIFTVVLADLPTLRIYPGNTGFLTIFRISGESIRITGFSKGETFNFLRAIILLHENEMLNILQ